MGYRHVPEQEEAPARVAARPGQGVTSKDLPAMGGRGCLRASHSPACLSTRSEERGQALGRDGVAVPAHVRQVLGAVCDLLVLLPRPPLLRASLPEGGARREPPCIEPARSGERVGPAEPRGPPGRVSRADGRFGLAGDGPVFPSSGRAVYLPGIVLVGSGGGRSDGRRAFHAPGERRGGRLHGLRTIGPLHRHSERRQA